MSDEGSKQTPEELVAAILTETQIRTADYLKAPNLRARLRTVRDHATRLAPLLAERDAAAGDMLAALEGFYELCELDEAEGGPLGEGMTVTLAIPGELVAEAGVAIAQARGGAA